MTSEQLSFRIVSSKEGRVSNGVVSCESIVCRTGPVISVALSLNL